MPKRVRSFGADSFLVVLVLALSAGAVWLLIPPLRPGDRLSGAEGEAAITATARSEPRSFNRLVARDRTSALVASLLHARLARIDLETQELEPEVAESWEVAEDGRVFTVRLREGVRFSDGAPLTADDVVFSFAAVYDQQVASPLAEPLRVGGRPLGIEAPDARTVIVTFPGPYGPGLRLLHQLPILPKHKLEGALGSGTFRQAWGLDTPPGELVGLGPFVLEEYVPGQRLVFARNPHYWKRDQAGRPLPYLDRLTVVIVPDQNAEMLRLEAGEADLVTAELRPDDVPAMRKAAAEKRVQLFDLGVGLDADFLWFNLTPAFQARSPGKAWLQSRALRQAVSVGVDRAAMAEAVFLGAGVPIYGPVTPANRAWHDAAAVPAITHDVGRARALLAAAGLTDRDGDGLFEQPDGRLARFSLLTQKGNTLRERAAAVLQAQLRELGLVVDVVTLEQPAVIERLTKGEYEAIYFGAQASDTDPASTLDFWLSSGALHPWHPAQRSPATAWEREIDDLMRRQVASHDPAERRRLFSEVQRIFAREQPAIYFVAPRIYAAASARVRNVRPALLQPLVLWNADRLDVER
jgi:peptide/nickel transport system substrate-binding protein